MLTWDEGEVGREGSTSELYVGSTGLEESSGLSEAASEEIISFAEQSIFVSVDGVEQGRGRAIHLCGHIVGVLPQDAFHPYG